MKSPPVPRARQRVKDAVTAEIVTVARAQLATEGAGALSLRAVAREMSMASSAIYRYFPSRDDLLTALITEAFDSLGDAAEAAAAADKGAFERWRSVCRAVRAWALEHPHEYALIYGSPVPGYEAPVQTVGPASRVALVLAGLLVDAQKAGELEEIDTAPLPRAVATEARRLAHLAMETVPLPVVARSILVWTQLFGHISFEVFGQLRGVVEDPEVMFEFEIATVASLLGLYPRHGRNHGGTTPGHEGTIS